MMPEEAALTPVRRGSPTEVFVLARDPRVVAAATAAARSVSGQEPRLFGNPREALAALSRPGLPPLRIMLEPAAAGPAWPELLATIDDPGLTDAMLFVAANAAEAPEGIAVLPAEPGELAHALSRPAGIRPQPPPRSAAALAAGLDRGALMLRYQPVVRIRDRSLVMLEALARWRGTPLVHGPDSFIPAVERAGLGRPLAVAVVSRAAQDIGALRKLLSVGVSANIPLEQMLQPDLPSWLARGLRTGALPRQALSLELTETAAVRDRSTLARALLRMAAAGHGVWLDDLKPGDGRLELMDLPFTGVKLDKSVVHDAPRSAVARRFIRQVLGRAQWHGRLITAEGVSSSAIWRQMAHLGVHRAQGFWVGRPLPWRALHSWSRSWAATPRL